MMKTLPLKWQVAKILDFWLETPTVMTLGVSVPTNLVFKPGQHVDVRLTSDDGYQAQRSYSIASAPDEKNRFELSIELITGGEVSTYFHSIARPGDQFEIRGPVGGAFTWDIGIGGPLLLLGAGSGIVPLMSMLRYRKKLEAEKTSVLCFQSAKTYEELIYRVELEAMVKYDNNLHLIRTLTRENKKNWAGYSRRIDKEMLSIAMPLIEPPKRTYICGSTYFIEVVNNELISFGIPGDTIYTEHFGPSG